MKKLRLFIVLIVGFMFCNSAFAYMPGYVEEIESRVKEIMSIESNVNQFKSSQINLVEEVEKGILSDNINAEDKIILEEYIRLKTPTGKAELFPVEDLKLKYEEFKKQKKLEKTNNESQNITKSGYNPPSPLLTYNRTKAVQYALAFAEIGNPEYDYYISRGLDDCTDFTSQVLTAGGMPWKRDWSLLEKYQPYNWYYDEETIPSWSWGGAQNFYDHAKERGEVHYYLTSDFNDVQLGDIMQVTWNEGDYDVDHTMVITDIDANGEIYLSYHNNNRKNRSLTDLLENHIRGGWGFWHVIY